ncbi:hypothetical protein HPULCUR_003360 [Helicostylum pulchrum]|uniref:Zn(2)-C6 fungal-type domain-containing protein n=1 Tax=Helicostylum pulchrum TaxID=562976 RepID=A0ABP9XV63_9FUNG
MANKRKVSCLPCRLKKVKCNGEKPCQRCVDKETECTYLKPGAVGRPPKNAVVNKLVLSKNTSSFCREFIFEHISLMPVLTPTRYIQDSNQMNLSHHLNCIFRAYFKRNTRRIANGEYAEVTPKVRIYDLTHYFTWMAADMANILIRRISKLKLTYYSDLEFSTTALAYDCGTSFFEPPKEDPLSINPLNSLPPEQAIKLIECFFCIHPYAFMLNKTMVLQSYWTDTIDALLLAVIYGTTIFKSQLLEGKPLELWDALNKRKRNPFLDYAHVLLSKVNAEATLSRYQAIVLLAMFEVTFGFPKRGMTLFGVSFMMATGLGLFDNTLPAGLNQVEKELLIVTFWAAYENTIRGCVELEQIPRIALAHHIHPLPPINSKVSKSCQYDIDNDHPKQLQTYNYLIETFYIKAVISRISCQLILQLPTKSNLPAETMPFFEDKAKEQDNSDIEAGIEKVLQEFKYFNQNNKSSFSPLQDYTLELYRLFYTICLRFKRTSLRTLNFSLHQRHLPGMLDLTDVNNVISLHRVLPDAITAVQSTLDYLSDPSCLNEEKCFFLPRGIIVSALDAAAQVLMYSYKLEQSQDTRHYLDVILNVLGEDIIWGDWGTADILKRAIQDFLSQHPPSLEEIPQSIFTSFDWMTSLIQPNNYLQYPFVVGNEPWAQDVNTVLLPQNNNITFDPPEDQQQYYPPPPNGQYNTQISPEQEHGSHSVPPPPFTDQPLKPYTEGPEHIKPASGWNDVWATVLWLCNVGAFIGLSVVGLKTYHGNQDSYNSVPSQNQYPGLTFDTTTFKIFGFSAIVGFGLSFMYLILAQM